MSWGHTFPFCFHLFLRTFQQPNPSCCNRSTTILFMISFLSRTIDFFFFFLSLWIFLWLAETSQQPISQTTWLKVTPHCNHCNHCEFGKRLQKYFKCGNEHRSEPPRQNQAKEALFIICNSWSPAKSGKRRGSNAEATNLTAVSQSGDESDYTPLLPESSSQSDKHFG